MLKLLISFLLTLSVMTVNSAEQNFNTNNKNKDSNERLSINERIGDLNENTKIRKEVSVIVDELVFGKKEETLTLLREYAVLLQEIQKKSDLELKNNIYIENTAEAIIYINFCSWKQVSNKKEYDENVKALSFIEKLTVNNVQRKERFENVLEKISKLNRYPGKYERVEMRAFLRCYGGKIPITSSSMDSLRERIEQVKTEIQLKQQSYEN